jgi:nucleotidyltransferase substrate binding protein (TIGR01987 family)
MKDILIEYHGVTNFAKGSPREIFEAAYSVNLIHDDRWQHMRADRNNIQHNYEEIPKLEEFKDKIFKQYIPLFEALSEEIEKIKEEK